MKDIDIVRAIKADFPGFDKPLLSKTRRPEKYGIRLLQRAEKAVADLCGVEYVPAPRKTDNRKYKDCLKCRVPKDIADKLRALALREESTVNEILYNLVVGFLTAREENAH